MSITRIISIDPGINITGFSIIDFQKSHIKLAAYVLEVEPLRSALSTALAAADKSRDATQRKYSARVRSKLAAPASDAVVPG